MSSAPSLKADCQKSVTKLSMVQATMPIDRILEAAAQQWQVEKSLLKSEYSLGNLLIEQIEVGTYRVVYAPIGNLIIILEDEA